MESKECTNCKIEKPYEDFYRRKGGLAGLHSHCKECIKAASKRNINPERKRLLAKENYHAYKDRKKALTCEWKNKNPQYFQEYRKRKLIQEKEGVNHGTDNHCPKHDRES